MSAAAKTSAAPAAAKADAKAAPKAAVEDDGEYEDVAARDWSDLKVRSDAKVKNASGQELIASMLALTSVYRKADGDEYAKAYLPIIEQFEESLGAIQDTVDDDDGKQEQLAGLIEQLLTPPAKDINIPSNQHKDFSQDKLDRASALTLAKALHNRLKFFLTNNTKGSPVRDGRIDFSQWKGIKSFGAAKQGGKDYDASCELIQLIVDAYILLGDAFDDLFKAQRAASAADGGKSKAAKYAKGGKGGKGVFVASNADGFAAAKAALYAKGYKHINVPKTAAAPAAKPNSFAALANDDEGEDDDEGEKEADADADGDEGEDDAIAESAAAEPAAAKPATATA